MLFFLLFSFGYGLKYVQQQDPASSSTDSKPIEFQDSTNEWTQEGADSFRSYSIKMKDNVSPPPQQTLNFSNPAKNPCNPRVYDLILTSSGRLIGGSSCPSRIAWPDNDLLFSTDFQNGNWSQAIFTQYPLTRLLMAADESHAIVQYFPSNDNPDGNNYPAFVKTGTGEILSVRDKIDDATGGMILIPNTKSTFLVDRTETINYVDLSSRTLNAIPGLSNNYRYPSAELYDGDNAWAADPTGPRVAQIVETKHPDIVARLVVWNVQVTQSGVQLTELWAYNYTFKQLALISQPSFTRDGRLLLVDSDSGFPYLYVFDAKTGKEVVQPVMLMDPNLYEVSITGDGKYAILKGLITSSLIVVSTKDRSFTRIDAYDTKDRFKPITIDEQNSIVYYVNQCHLFAFCLQSPKMTKWKVPICDSPSRATAIALGKYSGGQRRLFVGFDEIFNVTQIKVIEPPAIHCP